MTAPQVVWMVWLATRHGRELRAVCADEPTAEAQAQEEMRFCERVYGIGEWTTHPGGRRFKAAGFGPHITWDSTVVLIAPAARA